METLITILIIIICVLLGVVVLIQNPKGGGLDSAFGSAAQLGGVQKTTDFLERSTWTLAIALVVLSLATAGFTHNNPNAVSADDKFRDEPMPQQAPPSQPQQQQPAQPAQ